MKKKYKNLNFDAGCSREVVEHSACSREVVEHGADMLGGELDDLISKTILAMRATDAVD